MFVLTFHERSFTNLLWFSLGVLVPRCIAYRACLPSPLVWRVIVTVKHTLAIAGVTLDPTDDHLVTDVTVQDAVREVVRDVGLKLHRGASRKGVPPFPVHDNVSVGSVSGRVTTDIGV